MTQSVVRHMRVPRAAFRRETPNDGSSLGPNATDRFYQLVSRRPGWTLTISLGIGVLIGCLVKRR